jgi:hypothetical protein
MGDYLNGRIAIESVNGGYGLDFDFINWMHLIHEALLNGWKPVGRDSDSEMGYKEIGNFPVITKQDASTLSVALEISKAKLMLRLMQETNEMDFSKASNKNFGLSYRIAQLDDLLELLEHGECYLRAVHEELG